MTRKELFEEVVSRMEKPENKQRLEAQENNKNELSLQWHLNPGTRAIQADGKV